MTPEPRYCETGCGYKLPPEYAPHETTCGACLTTAVELFILTTTQPEHETTNHERPQP